MSSADPEDGNQLPLPLDEGEAGLSTVVSIGSAPRPGRTASVSPRRLEPAGSPLTEAEVAHRRAMLEHLTRQSA